MELHIVIPPRLHLTPANQLQQCFRDTFAPYYPALHFIADQQAIQQIPPQASVIIAGSTSSVNDRTTWHEQMCQFILQQNYHKLVGICFGAQLIAQVFGGKVYPSPQGWNLGIQQNQIISQLSANDPLTFDALFHHQEIITVLPKRFDILATARNVAVSCFSDQQQILGCQFHPEFSLSYHQSLMKAQIADIPEQVYQQANESLTGFSHQYDRQLIIDFLLQPLPKIST